MEAPANPKKSRLYWQCRRGMLELDYLLQHFFQQRFDHLSQEQQDAFEKLLGCEDDQLFRYLFGGLKPLQKDLVDVIESIRECAVD